MRIVAYSLLWVMQGLYYQLHSFMCQTLAQGDVKN